MKEFFRLRRRRSAGETRDPDDDEEEEEKNENAQGQKDTGDNTETHENTEENLAATKKSMGKQTSFTPSNRKRATDDGLNAILSICFFIISYVFLSFIVYN